MVNKLENERVNNRGKGKEERMKGLIIGGKEKRRMKGLIIGGKEKRRMKGLIIISIVISLLYIFFNRRGTWKCMYMYTCVSRVITRPAPPTCHLVDQCVV